MSNISNELSKVIEINTNSICLKEKKPKKIHMIETLVYSITSIITRMLIRYKLISITDRKYEIIIE